MTEPLRLLMAQMTSTNQHAGNIGAMRALAGRAADEGCALLALPEAAGLMEREAEIARKVVTAEPDDPFLAACREEAAQRKLWIHTGSTPIRASDGRFVNRSHLIDATGTITAHYDKIHLFDVFLADGEPRLESQRYAPGAAAVLADTPWGPFGLTICYDVRFPHLYRDYAKAGATVIFVPSAFTQPTGAAHWEILIRARAIENGCFVIAPAQTGQHDDGRKTWGQSLAVDPWGTVLADLGHAPGHAVVELDLSAVARTRAQIPSLANERRYAHQHGLAAQTNPSTGG